MIRGQIVDGTGTGVGATVTPYGELVVASASYSTITSNTMSSTGVAYNFAEPKQGKQIVITGIYLNGDKNVSVSDADVQVYEATGSDVTTVSKTILPAEVARNGRVDLGFTNPVLVNEGVWVNAKTDSANILATIAWYYV